MNETLYVKQNDAKRSLDYTLTIGDPASVINLTNATASLNIYNPVNGVVSTKSVTIVSEASGSVTYSLTADDTKNAGMRYLEWKVVYNDGTILHIPTTGYIHLRIVPDIA